MAKNDDNLLDQLGTEDEDAGDLLDEVIEDDSYGWIPEVPGDGVQGVVLKKGVTTSDFSDEPVPTVTIETDSGEKIRITGYGAVLRRELEDADVEPGDLLAVKYFGEKPIQRGRYAGKMYKHYGVAVRRRKV